MARTEDRGDCSLGLTLYHKYKEIDFGDYVAQASSSHVIPLSDLELNKAKDREGNFQVRNLAHVCKQG